MDDDALEEMEKKILILKEKYVLPLNVTICDVLFCFGQ
jgi:hypothetical protein